MATKVKGKYVSPKIPKDMYSAVAYACAEIRKTGCFNVAVRKASKRYGVDEEEIKALIRERRAAGQRYKNAARKESARVNLSDVEVPDLDALDKEYAELNADLIDNNAKIESLRKKVIAVFERDGLNYYKAVNASYSFRQNRTRKVFNTSRLKEGHSALYEEFVNEIEFSPLIVRFSRVLMDVQTYQSHVNKHGDCPAEIAALGIHESVITTKLLNRQTMEQISNNSPRFIEVFAACGEESPVQFRCPEKFCSYYFLNWNDVMYLGRSAIDGWLYLQMREFAYDDGANRSMNGYRELLTPYWVKEDFAHFVRRVNNGLPITMIKDGDE